MNIVFALAGIVITELYRRKDFYVLFVLTALLTLLMGSVNFFNEKTVRIVKDLALLLIWISALVIAIGTTARQIPAERENRTIFPLLAKPVTRAHVVVGKFAGCWFACGMALIVFYLFFGVITAARLQHGPTAILFEGLWLQWAMLGIVVALVLLGSVVFTAPSSNTTICFIVVVGILLVGKYLNGVALRQAEPLRSIVYAIYFFIPHLEFYDVRDLLVNDHAPVGAAYCALATLYAAVYSALLLFAAWLVFRRKPLQV